MSLNEWEKHTGSRKKNWKMSIRQKSTGEPLINLVSPVDLHQPIFNQTSRPTDTWSLKLTCSWMIFLLGPQSLLTQALRKKSCYNCKVHFCLSLCLFCSVAGSCNMTLCNWLLWYLQLMLTVLSVLNGQLNAVLFVDGLRIGTTTKL